MPVLVGKLPLSELHTDGLSTNACESSQFSQNFPVILAALPEQKA